MSSPSLCKRLVIILLAKLTFLLASSRMTTHTILVIRDAFLKVFIAYIGGGVLMAVVTGIGGVIILIMTDVAGQNGRAAMIERECVVGEKGWRPGCRCVALNTIGPKQSCMRLRFRMTGHTFSGSPSILPTDMTLVA